MAISASTGPIVVFGQSAIGPQTNPDLAPSMFWGGVALLDPRPPFTYFPGESTLAQDFAWLGVDGITSLSIVPYTKAVAAIAPSAASATTAIALVTASSAVTGVYVTPSITRSDTGVIDTGVNGAGLIALDAYCSVATTSIAAGVMTVGAAPTQPISPGMVLLTGGAPTAGGPLAGAIVTSQLSGTPGAQGTYQLSNGALSAPSATVTLAWPTPQACTVPFGQPSSIFLWNPAAMAGRAVGVTAAAGATATTATVRGYDCYGYPMTEAITIAAGAQASGKKAFKYIRSVTLNAIDAGHAYSVDTLDIFGFPLRSDTMGDVAISSAAGSLTALVPVTAATGYLPGVETSPATAVTGDVRGTYANFVSATGANKMQVRQSPQAYNIGTVAGLFGVPQFSDF